MIFNACADVDACDSMRGCGGVWWGGVGCLYKHSQPQRVCAETLLWEKKNLAAPGNESNVLVQMLMHVIP